MSVDVVNDKTASVKSDSLVKPGECSNSTSVEFSARVKL